MSTAICQPSVSSRTELNHVEKSPSDREISRRVLHIRSRWTPGERVRRRQIAEDRFADLLTTLLGLGSRLVPAAESR